MEFGKAIEGKRAFAVQGEVGAIGVLQTVGLEADLQGQAIDFAIARKRSMRIGAQQASNPGGFPFGGVAIAVVAQQALGEVLQVGAFERRSEVGEILPEAIGVEFRALRSSGDVVAQVIGVEGEARIAEDLGVGGCWRWIGGWHFPGDRGGS